MIEKGGKAMAMNATRMLLLTIAELILVGIWLTGFENVHWMLYVPVVLLVFAGATGYCPGLAFWTKIGFQNEPMSCELPGRKK
jgi:hypothetical protein